VITDAAHGREQLATRRRCYARLMAIYLLGLAVGGALYEALYGRAWGLGLAVLIITGPLPWVAVILAKRSPPTRAGHEPLE
jgi:Protein of unknown function (DUF3099)